MNCMSQQTNFQLILTRMKFEGCKFGGSDVGLPVPFYCRIAQKSNMKFTRILYGKLYQLAYFKTSKNIYRRLGYVCFRHVS